MMKTGASPRALRPKWSSAADHVEGTECRLPPLASAQAGFPGADWNAVSAAILGVGAEDIVVADWRGTIVLANRAATQLAQVDPMGRPLDSAPRIWGEMFDRDEHPVPV